MYTKLGPIGEGCWPQVQSSSILEMPLIIDYHKQVLVSGSLQTAAGILTSYFVLRISESRELLLGPRAKSDQQH